MEESGFASWAVEKRLDMLSERRSLPNQEEALAELDGMLDGGLSPAERVSC